MAFTFSDPEIVESSGLARRRRPGRDHQRLRRQRPGVRRRPGHGRHGRRHRLGRRARPTSRRWRRPDDGAVWVGDIGDNTGVARLGPGRPGAGRPRRADVDARRRTTWSTPTAPHDAESLLRAPGDRPAVRRHQGGLRRHAVRGARRALADGGPTGCARSATVLPLATDGAFFPDGRHLRAAQLRPGRVIYAFPSLEPVATFDLPRPAAGRGHRGRRADGRLLLSSEGRRSPRCCG